jgi:integrase
VRRPRIDHESHATGLDRDEVGGLLVGAGLGAPCEHALVSPLALNGLRVSEATGADIDRLGIERGHRTLTILRKGGKIVTIPLTRRTARAPSMCVCRPTPSVARRQAGRHSVRGEPRPGGPEMQATKVGASPQLESSAYFATISWSMKSVIVWP